MKNIIWLSLVCFLTALLVHTVANPDIWYHLALGQNILTFHTFHPQELVTITPSYFVNFYWFFQVISLFAMKALGPFGLTFLFGILWITIFWVWSKLIRFKDTQWEFFILGLLTIILFQIRFQERPEIFSFLFLILDLYFINAWQKPYESKKIFWSLGVIQILWCNSHGYFIFGPAVFLVKLVSLYIETPDHKKLLNHLSIFLALLALSMVSPFGWNTWKGFLYQWFYMPTAAAWITEMHSTSSFGFSQWPFIVFWIFWFFILAGCLFKLKSIRKNFYILSLAATGLFVSFEAARNIPLLPLLSAPLIGDMSFSKYKFKLSKSLVIVIIFTLTMWVITDGYFESLSQPYKFGIGISESIFPTKLQEDLKSKEIPEGSNWFSDGTIGSYLEFFQPTLRLYGDTRYMDEKSIEYFQSFEDPKVFEGVHHRQNFDNAVFDTGRSPEVIRSLLINSRWRLVYRNLKTVVFQNVDSRKKNIFDQKLKPLFQGEDLSELSSGNCAIQWALILAEARHGAELTEYLEELKSAKVVPSPILEVSLAYLKVHPGADLLEKIFSLRPRMLALTPVATDAVDRELAEVRSGAFWSSP